MTQLIIWSKFGLAQCNLAMMVNTLINHPELDDRFKINNYEETK